MGLSEDQDREVARIAELEVRRYFDDYLQNVFPEQMKAVRQHTHLMIERHDTSPLAHDGVARKVNRGLWLATGAGAVVGLGGVPAIKAFIALFG